MLFTPTKILFSCIDASFFPAYLYSCNNAHFLPILAGDSSKFPPHPSWPKCMCTLLRAEKPLCNYKVIRLSHIFHKNALQSLCVCNLSNTTKCRWHIGIVFIFDVELIPISPPQPSGCLIALALPSANYSTIGAKCLYYKYYGSIC